MYQTEVIRAGGVGWRLPPAQPEAQEACEPFRHSRHGLVVLLMRTPPRPAPLLTSPRPLALNVNAEQGRDCRTALTLTVCFLCVLASPWHPRAAFPTASCQPGPLPVSQSQPEAKGHVTSPCCCPSTPPGSKQTSLLKSCTRLTLSYENRLPVFLPQHWMLRRDRSSSASLWTSLVPRRAAVWAGLCRPSACVQAGGQPRTQRQQPPGTPGPRPSGCRHRWFQLPRTQ